MTTTASPSMSASDDPPARPLPLWASIPIILACLAAGGTIIRWYVGTHLKADEPHLLGDMPTRAPAVARGNGNGNGNGNGRNWAGWLGGGARGITPLNGGREGYEAHTEHARVTYVVNGNGRPPVVNLTYGPDSAYNFVSDDVRKTVFAASRIAGNNDRDKQYVKAIKLTDAQAQTLRRLSRPAMAISATDRTGLLKDFADYRAAKPTERASVQSRLLADLDGIAERSREPTRAAFAKDAAEINAIVSPDQWAQLKAMGLQP